MIVIVSRSENKFPCLTFLLSDSLQLNLSLFLAHLTERILSCSPSYLLNGVQVDLNISTRQLSHGSQRQDEAISKKPAS
jgi:hypothetical protein